MMRSKLLRSGLLGAALLLPANAEAWREDWPRIQWWSGSVRITGNIEMIPGQPITPQTVESVRVWSTEEELYPVGQLVSATYHGSYFELSYTNDYHEPVYNVCEPVNVEIVVAGTGERITRSLRACRTGQSARQDQGLNREYETMLRRSAESLGVDQMIEQMPPIEWGDVHVPMGTIAMARPTTATGSFPGVNATVANDVYVAIDSQGIVVPVSSSGTFIVPGLPPGTHRAQLRAFNPSTTNIRGTSWMDIHVLSRVQSNHVGPTVTITRTAIAPTSATVPVSGTATMK